MFRREIETAVASRRNIVPVFLEGFSFGSASVDELLGNSLSPLKRYNGIGMPSEYFQAAQCSAYAKGFSIFR